MIQRIKSVMPLLLTKIWAETLETQSSTNKITSNHWWGIKGCKFY